MSRTKLVFTLGPASDRPGVLKSLLQTGMHCARFNFSHGSHAEHGRRFRQLRQAAQSSHKTVATLMDLCGPKLRVGVFPTGEIHLAAGAKVRITSAAVKGSNELIPVVCPGLEAALAPGHLLLLNDGLIRLQVVSVRKSEIRCRVLNSGILKDHQGLNLPGVPLKLSAITAKDKADLAFGLALGVDLVALSFVRHPREIHTLRQLIASAGSSAKIVAKIEKPEAIPHLEEIIQAADGVMIARGDLGVELGPAEVPILQKRIIALARAHDKFVITATQMLQSMMASPTPTRAEASDIANAIFDGTDAIMLSGESAAGQYPREAAAMMKKIAEQAEAYPEFSRGSREMPSLGADDEVVRAGVVLAEGLKAQALVVFTHSGNTARLVSRQRPQVPVFALAHSQAIDRQLQIWWGIEPLVISATKQLEATLKTAEKFLLASTPIKPGQTVVILASSPHGAPTNFLKVHKLKNP